MVVAADDGAEPVEFGSFAVMTQGWGEVVFDEVLQLRGVLPDLGDVPVGVGDVLAGGSAVVLVGSAADVVLGGPELAQRFGRVEHAGHGAAGEDLQERVGDQVVGVFGVGQDAAGELLLGGVDAMLVVVCGWAADVFALCELAVVLGEGVEAEEPVLVGVLVGEAGVVGAGVAEGDLDVQVAVLDRAGDEA